MFELFSFILGGVIFCLSILTTILNIKIIKKKEPSGITNGKTLVLIAFLIFLYCAGCLLFYYLIFLIQKG